MSQAETGILRQPSTAHPHLQTFWDYLQHEILYLTWILMEISLLTPVLASFILAAKSWPLGLLFMWLFLLMYLPFNLVRLMSTLDWPRSRQRLILAMAVPLIYLFTLRTLIYQPVSLLDFRWLGQFFSTIAESDNAEWQQNLIWFVLIIFLWWRGLRLIGKTFSISSAGLRLRVGGLILAPFVILVSINSLPWTVVPFILIFFIASLTAVALTRAEEIERQQSGRSVSLNPKWLISVEIAALLIIFAAALITFLVSGETMLTILGWFDPLWRALYAGGIVILNTIFNLLAPFLNLISLFLEFLVSLLKPVMSQLDEMIALPIQNLLTPIPEATADIGIETGTNNGLKIIDILLMIAVILAITLALGRVYQRAVVASRTSESAIKSTDKTSSAKPGLGQRIRNRLDSLRGWRTAASVRRIYQNMCRAAAVNGYPRADAETPFEYLATLAKAWPENQTDTRLVTEAYVMVRYGELPESAESLAEIRQAWKRLETVPPIDTKKAEQPTLDLDSHK